MTSKAARREYLQALAEFDRACLEFSERMARVVTPDASPEVPGTMRPLLARLGPRKPAKRALRSDPRDQATPATRAQRR